MSYKITKEYVWVAVIDDQAGALADKLRALASGGVDLELIITRRERQGRALMFVSPLRTKEEVAAATNAGLFIAESLHNLRVEGPNVPGLGARITGAIDAAGVSMRGYSAASMADQSVTNIAFDTLADQDRALEVLQRELAS